MRKQKEYIDFDIKTIITTNIIDYDGTIIKDHYITPDGKVYKLEEDGRYSIVRPYLNTCNNKTSCWKHGYYKIRINGRLYNLHWLLARAYVPGYQIGLVAHHIDGDSRNNFSSNLEWITRSENVVNYWKSLSTEEFEIYKKKFSDGVKEGHKKGNYKNHLKNLHNKG